MDTKKRMPKNDCLITATVYKRDVRMAFDGAAFLTQLKATGA